VSSVTIFIPLGTIPTKAERAPIIPVHKLSAQPSPHSIGGGRTDSSSWIIAVSCLQLEGLNKGSMGVLMPQRFAAVLCLPPLSCWMQRLLY
jgi:hypothetical protein